MHRRPLLLAIALAVALPGPAHAQLGGFIKKKIAEKVVDRAAEKAGLEQPDPGAAAVLGPELTADTLERVLRGLEAVAAKLAASDSARQRQTAVDRQLSELRTRHAAEIDAYQKRRATTARCRDDAFQKIGAARGDSVAQKAKTDPALAARFNAAWMEYTTKANEASRRGDSAALGEIQQEYYRKIFGLNVNFRQDTLAVDRECGTVPPRPAVVALDDSLSRLRTALGERYRRVELDVTAEGVARSGLPEQRFATARERIERWYVLKAKRGGARFWSSREDELLERQRPRIERVMRALGVQA